MVFRDLVMDVLRTIWSHKLRSALTMFGIAWGIVSIVLMVAAGDGNEMVNYRVRGDYYIVDKLFDQAVLVSGVGREQDRVSIRYTGGAR